MIVEVPKYACNCNSCSRIPFLAIERIAGFFCVSNFILELMIHAHITLLYISALPVFGSVRVCNVCMYVCVYACMCSRKL